MMKLLLTQKFKIISKLFKKNKNHGGIIEISIFIKIYKVNISIYILQNNEDEYYTHYTNIWHYDKNHDKFLVLLYSSGPHFDYLKITENNNINNSENKSETKSIKINDIKLEREKGKNLDIMNLNKYVIINNHENFYDNIYNYLYSKKLNTKENGKIDWHKVIYPPNLINEKDGKTTKDKKRQNFRIIAEKHMLTDDNILHIKKLNKENKIENLKIPFEGEKYSILEKYHNQKGHLSTRRVYNEIIADKYYWKTMRNDILNYISKCPICVREKKGENIISNPVKIIPNGPKDRYVLDGWKLHKTLAEETGFTWVIDVIDYFSKYMMSYPVIKNDSINALNAIKQFCLMIGIPQIIQSDNGSEYRNSLFEEFCLQKNIKHIFSSPHNPQANGIIEVSHKEIRKFVMINYSENPDNFNLQNVILEAIDVHNNKIHTVTKKKPIDLINTKDEKLIMEVLETIKEFNKNIKNNGADEVEVGTHVLIKKNCAKSGKRLIIRKLNIRDINIIATITNIYGNGLYSIIIDEEYANFDLGEEIIANSKQILKISDEDWNLLKNEYEKKINYNRHKIIKSKEKKEIKTKNKKGKKYRKNK